MVDDPNTQDDGFFLEDENMLAADPEMGGEPGARPSVKEIWKNNPSLKIFAVVAGLAILLISYVVFGSSDDTDQQQDVSIVAPTKSVTQAPGTAELPPAYEDAVRQASEKRVEEALATGGSALPTPIARPAERIEAPVEVAEKDPLSEWRREAEARRAERKKEEVKETTPEPAPIPQLPLTPPAPTVLQNTTTAEPVVAPPPPLPTGPTPEQVQAYMQTMQQQVQTVMETQVPKESVLIKMNIDAAARAGTATPAAATASAASAAATSAAVAAPKPIITAGTIAYAQTLTEANSDVPGPILAEIASGPLVGGRAIGTFQVAEDKLVLQFNRIVKDGVEYQVQTFALDPATTLTAMSTDVNRHYFSRIVLPAAARFVESFADAATQQDSTTVISNGTVVTTSQDKLDTKEQVFKGLKEAGQQASDVIDEDSERPITVKVAMNTRIGILFTEAVYDAKTQANMNQQQQQQFGQTVFNATPMGQAYNLINSNAAWGSTQQPFQTYPSYPGTQAQQQVVQPQQTQQQQVPQQQVIYQVPR